MAMEDTILMRETPISTVTVPEYWYDWQPYLEYIAKEHSCIGTMFHLLKISTMALFLMT